MLGGALTSVVVVARICSDEARTAYTCDREPIEVQYTVVATECNTSIHGVSIVYEGGIGLIGVNFQGDRRQWERPYIERRALSRIFTFI